MSKIVKNKERTDEYEKTRTYVPEYIRLGVSPTTVYEKVKKDFEMLPFKKKKKSNVSKQTPPKTEERIFSLENDPRLSSTVLDEDIMFPPGLFSKQGVPAPAPKVKKKSHPSSVQKGYYEDEDENEDEDEDENEDESDEEDSEESDDAPSEDNSFLKNLKGGDFAIIYQGDICFVSKDISKIELVIETLIKEGFEGEEISLSDITLIKLIPLKIGVCALG